MQTSQSIGTIAAALAKAQGSIRNAAKDTANPFFRSTYAPLDTVIDAIKAALAANEIAFVQDAASTDAKVSVTTRLIHSSGQWIETSPLTATAKNVTGVYPTAIGHLFLYNAAKS